MKVPRRRAARSLEDEAGVHHACEGGLVAVGVAELRATDHSEERSATEGASHLVRDVLHAVCFAEDRIDAAGECEGPPDVADALLCADLLGRLVRPLANPGLVDELGEEPLSRKDFDTWEELQLADSRPGRNYP